MTAFKETNFYPK